MKKAKFWGVALVAFAALVLALYAVLRTPEDSGGSPEGGTASFPPGGPAEFIYLDTPRVASYLTQVDGGQEGSKKFIHKLNDSLNGKANLENVLEAGGSRSEEDVVERVVTPSASSAFFALTKAMEESGNLTPVRLNDFRSRVRPLGEGGLVVFHTAALLSPSYLNQFLALKRAHGVRDLFPPDGGGDAAPHNTPGRLATWRFKGELGKDPRVDLAIRVKRPKKHGSVVYLLPINAALLTEEQSLLSHGGGQLTVVGKLVRIWPETGDSASPAYVDTATRATWEGPLRGAPGELICRTNPRCKTQVGEDGLRGPARRRAIEEARGNELGALHLETRIERRGAVVIPIAIYK